MLHRSSPSLGAFLVERVHRIADSQVALAMREIDIILAAE